MNFKISFDQMSESQKVKELTFFEKGNNELEIEQNIHIKFTQFLFPV